MPVTFQLNGQPLVAPGNPGLGSPVIKMENQQADTLTVVQRGRTVHFDDAPLFAFNDRLVLTRDPGDGSGAVTVFIGTIQEIPRRLGIEETITYVAHGPWQWLSTYHYLQTYQIADNPDLGAPTLIGAYLGRVVIGQAPNGTRQQLGAALADIINWAIGSGCPILLGSITGFAFEVPWDQATDLTCDQAIMRLLQSWAPDAVVTWDYTTTTAGVPTPTISIARRAALPVKTLAVAPVGAAGIDSAYVPFESIDLVPLYAQQCIRLRTWIDGAFTMSGPNTLTFVYDYTHTWTRIPFPLSPWNTPGLFVGYDSGAILTSPYGGSDGIPADQCVFYLDNTNLLYFIPYTPPSDIFQYRGLGNPKKQLPKFFCAPLPDMFSSAVPSTVPFYNESIYGTPPSVYNATIIPKIEFPTLVYPSSGLLGHRYDMTAKWGAMKGGGYYDMSTLTASQWRDLRGITFTYSHPGAFDNPYSGGTVTTHVEWELL